MNARPSAAPGRVTLRTITASIITNSAGIITFEQRSIPPEMPPRTITPVIAMNSA